MNSSMQDSRSEPGCPVCPTQPADLILHFLFTLITFGEENEIGKFVSPSVECLYVEKQTGCRDESGVLQMMARVRKHRV